MSSRPDQKLGKGLLAAYGQLVVPLAVIGLPVAIYIPPFYAGTLGLDLAAVGLVLMLARLSDVVTDPLIGRLSDKTRSRFGRRRPWVLAGVPVMMVAAYMLFLPPAEVSIIYLLVWIAAIYLGFTLIVLPYIAWGAELSSDYNERSRVTGAREIFLLLGLLISISAPIAGSIAAGETGNAASRPAMAALGLLTIVLLPIAALILFAKVPEPKRHIDQQVDFFKGLKIVLKNGPFRIILASLCLSSLAGSVNAAVAILFFEHVMRLGDASLILIFVLFFAGIIGTPVWVWLGRRIGKHRAIAVAGMVSLTAFALVPVLAWVIHPDSFGFRFWGMIVLITVQGLAYGASPILVPSILADVSDLDTIKSGEERAGFVFAFLGMVRKMFEAAGVGLALPALAWIGFNPQTDENTTAALLALTGVYALVPLVLWMGSIAVIWNFPLNAARHARLRAALDRRMARRAAE